MNHLQILLKTYDDIGVQYVVRHEPKTGWSVVFLSSINRRKELETEDIDYLTRQYSFMEFTMDGRLASY